MAIKLDDLQGGVLSEKINRELDRIFKDIKDPNSDESKARTLTITLKFKPSKNSDLVELTPSIKTTLAPPIAEPTTMIVEKDFVTGKVVAKEYNNQLKGQVNMEELENELKEEELKKEEYQTNNVVDLRAK